MAEPALYTNFLISPVYLPFVYSILFIQTNNSRPQRKEMSTETVIANLQKRAAATEAASEDLPIDTTAVANEDNEACNVCDRRFKIEDLPSLDWKTPDIKWSTPDFTFVF